MADGGSVNAYRTASPARSLPAPTRRSLSFVDRTTAIGAASCAFGTLAVLAIYGGDAASLGLGVYLAGIIAFTGFICAVLRSEGYAEHLRLHGVREASARVHRARDASLHADDEIPIDVDLGALR